MQLNDEQIDDLRVRLTYFAADNCQLETSKQMWAGDIAQLCNQAKLANSGGEVVAWIPVSERLPEEGTPVLADDGCGHCIAYLNGDTWLYDGGEPANPIRHWQPLPASPVAPRG